MSQTNELWLIVGAGGMLGNDVTAAVKGAGIPVRSMTSAELDITQPDKVGGVIEDVRPSVVINAAGMTNVDGCETMVERAFAVNARGAEHLARICSRMDVFLVHISTDYVFDGQKGAPYTEDDAVGPLGVYGRSKAEGERLIREVLPDAHCIVRTQWLFGLKGKNFVEAILGQTERTKTLRVVSDQHGSPTYTMDLAEALVVLARMRARGTYHVTNAGMTTWHGFAAKIVEYAGLWDVTLQQATTQEIARPAARPAYGVLDNSKFIQLTGRGLRHWHGALREYMVRREYVRS